MEPIKIALIDDQQLFRSALASALALDERLTILLETPDGYAFLEYLSSGASPPHLALIDMAMPRINGLELTKILQEQYPAIKIIIVSINYRDSLIAKMIANGASAFLHKNCDIDQLKQAIIQVHEKGFYIDTATLTALKSRSQRNVVLVKDDAVPIDLTKREEEVLTLICREFNNQQIADHLYISVRTVEGHRNNLLLKTGCKNTAGLVVFAIKYGLFEILR